jgi:hypothetical protein
MTMNFDNNNLRKLAVAAVTATALLGLNGCTMLLTPSSIISMSASIVGGVANGAVMGGSVIGVIREKANGGYPGSEAALAAQPSPDTQITGDNDQPMVSSAPERTCYTPSAGNLSAPCS